MNDVWIASKDTKIAYKIGLKEGAKQELEKIILEWDRGDISKDFENYLNKRLKELEK